MYLLKDIATDSFYKWKVTAIEKKPNDNFIQSFLQLKRGIGDLWFIKSKVFVCQWHTFYLSWTTWIGTVCTKSVGIIKYKSCLMAYT